MNKTNFILFVGIIALSFACNDPHQHEVLEAKRKLSVVRHQMDSLKGLIKEMQKKKDSNQLNYAGKIEKREEKSLKRVKKSAKIVEKKPKVPKKADSIFYYYKNSKKVSLIITPWENHRRKLLFLDPFGQLTYKQEDVKLSYSKSTSIKAFHPNGAVSKITVFMNPGASLYMYNTTITFDINNNPSWKYIKTTPPKQTHLLSNDSYYWDKKTKSWKKQHVVYEQPVPKGKKDTMMK